MLGFIKGLFSKGALQSVENVATEWIETDMEKAEAQALMVKTLDPNGLMRRRLSERVTDLYTVYILTTLGLIVAEACGLEVSEVTGKITDLFVPVTTMFTTIVAASFGVNGFNSYKGK